MAVENILSGLTGILNLANVRELPKRPTSILFTAHAKTLLVSDKFGDVFSYTFDFAPLTEKQKKDALSSHENPSGGTLILGHASLLNAFLLSRDEKYIITADRDEHIRVSWYPQGYNIEMYCLGHTKFVSAIHNPAFAPADLVSGGGDLTLKIWDWMAGTVKHEIPVWDVVEPYIRVSSSKRKRGDDGEDVSGAKRKGRGKKARGKGKAKAESEAPEGEETPVAEAPEDVAAASGATTGETAGTEEKVDKVLVIHKIETTNSRRIIFSAVGATALFSVDYPSDRAVANVRVLEFEQPVLDFVVIPQENKVWVTLDGNWTDGTEPSTKCFVLVVDISESGELVKSITTSPICEALNSKVLLPASAEDLKKLELYNDLVAMPKGNDAENEEGDIAAPEPEKQNKKILGRLKNKQKVLEKEQALASAPGTSDDGAKEPDAKKPRSEVGDKDVVMAEA
ncbi:hypothetical protein DXG01_002565 [Tephrocybe rancida]|nr:hypothetical protein DXG01_002565 [Tephrocybe rancida]